VSAEIRPISALDELEDLLGEDPDLYVRSFEGHEKGRDDGSVDTPRAA
jgi:hypothetical protein